MRHVLALMKLAPLALLFGTTLHEGAHAVAAIVEGGGVRAFRPYPQIVEGHFAFGFTAMSEPNGAEWLVNVAPVLASTLVAAIGLVAIPRVPQRALGVAFLFAFLTPMIDVSMAASGLFCAAPKSDLYRTFHGFEQALVPAALAYFYVFGAASVPVARRAFPAIGVQRYAALLALLLAVPWLRRLAP